MAHASDRRDATWRARGAGAPGCARARARPGELLVNVEAAGVNFRDVYERKGGGAYEAETPHLAGVEGAGTVVGTGERVAWSDAQGSYAEQVVVRADAAVPVPDGISTEVAAAAMLQASTAHYLATSTYPIQPGDTVIVHAAAGGVGLLLTQIAKRRGGRVIATTSTEEKARARARRGRRRDDRLRGLRRAGEGAHRRRGRRRGLRRHRRRDLRRVAGRAAAARLHGAVRRGERPADPVPIAKLNARLALPHAPDARPLRPRGRRAADARRPTSSAGSRRASSRCASAAATRSKTPRAPRPTSRRARRPAS